MVRRKYASFFEPHPTARIDLRDTEEFKQRKEADIVNYWLDVKEQVDEIRFESIRRNYTDPPDFIAFDQNNARLAIELTELVDQQTVELNEQENNYYRKWNDEDLINKIEYLIHEKDGKSYHEGPYSKIILVIFTDEPTLSYKRCNQILNHHTFTEVNQINETYLLFSYDPNFDEDIYHLPFIKLLIQKTSD
jgi:hypothetical protein